MPVLDREYEKFTGGPTQSVYDRYHVTINKRNIIGLNEKLYRELGKPALVYLYFNRARDVIVVEPCVLPHSPEAFPVKRKTHGGWRINASPFCRHFNVRLDATYRFTDPDLRDGRLHLKLSQTVIIRQFRRPKNKKPD